MHSLNELHSEYISNRSEQARNALFAAILAFAKFKLQDADEAAEVAADLVNGIERFRGDGTFSSWLSSICWRHRSEVIKRKVADRKLVPLRDDDEEADGQSTPISRLPLAHMDPDTREAAELILSGHTFALAAAKIGVSEWALTMRLRRLGEKLSKNVKFSA